MGTASYSPGTVSRGVAAASALGLAAIHVLLVPEHLDEKFYIGVLFAVGAVLLVVAVLGLLMSRTRRLGWWLGALVSAGMFVGYVLSRTVGLPQGYREEWGDPLGLASLALEATFLIATIVAATTANASTRAVRPRLPRATGGHHAAPRR